MIIRKQSRTSRIKPFILFFILPMLAGVVGNIYIKSQIGTKSVEHAILDTVSNYDSPSELYALEATQYKQEIEKLKSELTATKASKVSRGEVQRIHNEETAKEPIKISPVKTSEVSEKIHNAIKKASSKHGIEYNLIKAIIKQESNFNTKSISHAGAQGLMQLMPDTAKYLKLNPWDIDQNVEAGTIYLKDQIATFGSLDLALAAYNAGPENVKKYKGIPPFRETMDYVKKVMSNYMQYKKGGMI